MLNYLVLRIYKCIIIKHSICRIDEHQITRGLAILPRAIISKVQEFHILSTLSIYMWIYIYIYFNGDLFFQMVIW